MKGRNEKKKTHPLENLLPPNIAQTSIQILDLPHKILHRPLIRALDRARLPNSHIKLHLDRAHLNTTDHVAPGRVPVRRRKAQTVLAAVRGGEGEAALPGALLRDDAVVVVEDFFDGYEEA